MYYIIDSCSLLSVGECSSTYNKSKSEILSELCNMIENGNLVYPKQVIGEIERHGNEELVSWTKENSKEATRFGTNYETFKEVMSHPIASKVLDIEKKVTDKNDEADPYLLELSLTLKEKTCVQ